VNNEFLTCQGSWLSRRNLLLGLGAGAFAWLGHKSALAGGTLKPKRGHDHVLVVAFMRGGWDGLNVLVPYFEEDYYRARPNLAIGRPGERGLLEGERCLDLNGKFGIHPALRPLHELYGEGKLAALHAVGSRDETRSHFEAMSAMERGLATDGPGPADGWIARHLAATAAEGDTPLRAVALGTTLPDSLRGATSVATLSNLNDYRLRTVGEDEPWFEAIEAVYAQHSDTLSRSGAETLKALRRVREIADDLPQPENGAAYPETGLGRGFADAARLIRADVGLEVACLDMGGWDTHVAQGTGVGWMPTLLTEVGNAVGAFAKDLGGEMKRVTVVVMSEFGRRVGENAGLGTDHGRGGAMFVLGGGVKGGQVIADWPGLGPEILDGPGDLPVTTDYRDVLAEILRRRHANADPATAFPAFTPKPVGVLA